MYAWTASWAELPQEPLGWMHSGIAYVDGEIVVAHPGAPVLLRYDAAGRLTRSVHLEGVLEPHSLWPADGGLWIGDVGFRRHGGAREHRTERARGRVVLVDDSGAVQRELDDPGEGWSPTDVVVVEETGNLWVADGYGKNVVHHFDRDGTHLLTLTGEEGAGAFATPHGLLVDRRRGEPELYVSDRANARIQVFDLDGRFRRTAGEGVVVTPTDMTTVGGALALTDFTQARVTILDEHDRLVAHVGANPGAPDRDGWPNARDEHGNLVRPALPEGKFNSPHTLTSDPDGNLFVTEWVIGGRLSKLAVAAPEGAATIDAS